MSDLESDVSQIERKSSAASSIVINSSPSLTTKLIQFFVIALFFVGMVGAFCYVILQSNDSDNENSEITHDTFNFTDKWSVFRSEYSDSGYCILSFPINKTENEKKSEDGSNEDDDDDDDSNSIKFETYWYQDDNQKKINFRTDLNYVAYVFSDYTWWVLIDEKTEEPISCYKDPFLSYNEFIYRLGLYDMVDRHSEIRRIRNNKKVYVFDGEPSTAPLRNNTKVSYFVRSYVDYNTGVLLGYDTYYSRKISNISHVQCWFDEMINKKPNIAVWATLPSICE